MSFIQTGFLIACAAVVIPVLVHLLSRWQVRRLELGTMRFLQEVVRDGAQRRKIRRWFLLLTRAALVALLALLFARPFLREQTQRDGNRLRLVLIDRSASMAMQGESGRLIDDAVAAASDFNRELGSDAIIQWAWFDRHVQPLPPEITRPSAPRAVAGATDYFAALSWARDHIAAHSAALADLVVVTDLQQSGLVTDALMSETLKFPSDVPVHLIDVGRPAANNLAITGVRPPAARVESDREVEFSVTLFNYGTLLFEDIPVTATVSDATRTVRLKKPINLPGGEAADLSFNFGKLEPGTWQLTVAVDVDDDLATDNLRFSAIQVAEPIHVLVLDTGSSDEGVAAKSYYLATALEQGGHRARLGDHILDDQGLDLQEPDGGRFHADVVYLEDEAEPVLDARANPLVVVADAGTLAAGTIRKLESYVRSGGNLLVFAGDSTGGGSVVASWEQTGLAPGALQSPQPSGTMPFRIVSVSTGGTMLQPFEDPQRGDVSRLAFKKLLPVSVHDHTEVLAWFDHARPALTQHLVGSGRVAWFLSSADASWGNWTTSPLYLPLVQQMAADLLGLTGEGPVRFRLIGDEDINRRRRSKTGLELTPVALGDAGGSPSQLMFSQLGFEQHTDALYVVNGLAKESDPTRLEAKAFAEHFDLRLAGATDAALSASVEDETRRELWPWLAAAVFVLLVAEFALANRTPA